MTATPETVLCHYRYDPLDRLVDCSPSAQINTQRFYLKERLACEIQGAVQRSIFQHDEQLLAQQQRQGGAVETTLLATDQQRSVLHMLDATQPHPLAYTPYGHRAPESGLFSLLGFNGERPDSVTGHYLLGNGYRAFNPVLMRFNSPDSWSPFGKGGLNAYGYCGGDSVNRSDPTGHIPILRGLKLFKASVRSVMAANRFAKTGASAINIQSAPPFAAGTYFEQLPLDALELVTEQMSSRSLRRLVQTSEQMKRSISSISATRIASKKKFDLYKWAVEDPANLEEIKSSLKSLKLDPHEGSREWSRGLLRQADEIHARARKMTGMIKEHAAVHAQRHIRRGDVFSSEKWRIWPSFNDLSTPWRS
jgi:RHS repeat-associated protein